MESLIYNRGNSDNQDDEDDASVVEFATLILPSSAMGSGLEAGDGDQVVLEASSATVEHLQNDENLNDQAHISGVVDLEILSEIVGVSEEEFIAELASDQQVVLEDRNDAKQAVGEQTSLLASDALPQQQVGIEETENVDRVALPADPFIETLAHVLPSIPEKKTFNGEDSISIPPSLLSGPLDTINGNPSVSEAASTKISHDLHAGHDAFLLHMPDYETTDEDHFVLALPTIHLVESEVSSQLSDDEYHRFTLLEKAMSFIDAELPSDIQSIHLEAHHYEEDRKQDGQELQLNLIVDRKVPVIGYVILFSGLVALASVGAAVDLQEGPTACMKCLWRNMGTSLVLAPLALKSILGSDGFPQLSVLQWGQLVIASVGYVYAVVAFAISLEFTTMANAFVLGNMASVIIIAGRFILRFPTLKLEITGAFIGFTGAVICASSGPQTLANDEVASTSARQMLGNALAFSSSFGVAIYLLSAKKFRASMDLFVFMFHIMAFGAFFLFLYIILSGEVLTFDMHPNHGIFGWLNLSPDRLPLELYIILVCNLLGTLGYVATMKYFDPVVPATVMLMEPVIGALLGFAAGTADLPGPVTWFGDLIVAAGTLCVVKSGAKKSETIDATQALKQTTGDGESISIVKSSKSGGGRSKSSGIKWSTGALGS